MRRRTQMPKLARWSPVDDLAAFRDRMNQLFEDFVGGSLLQRSLSEARWTPSVDVYETDTEVVVKAEVPGMKKEDLQVAATPEAITISGQTATEKEVREESYVRRERRTGRFSRTLPLPAAIKADETKAKFVDGVLEVRAPKEHAGPAEGPRIGIE
jgi:HSP20 family protein